MRRSATNVTASVAFMLVTAGAHAGDARFASCGAVVAGVECPLFAADAGGRYVVAGLDATPVGERVWVSGMLDPTCATTCQQGDGCIIDSTIEPCFSACVELVGVTQGCVIFETDDGEIVGVENTAGMFPPGRVYVTGPVVEPAFFCFPFPGPGVFDNLIGPCFEACGRLVDLDGCVRLQTDDGVLLDVENTGTFTAGNRVRIAGIVISDGGPACAAVSAGTVRNNTIAEAAADLDCDGHVGFTDLTRLLVDWGPCRSGAPCPSDLDRNGSVGFADVSVLLALWTG